MTATLYGVEAEFFGVSAYDAAVAVSEAGVTCEAEDYNHRARDYYKIVEDSSVAAEGNELVSPILRQNQPGDGDGLVTALRAIRETGGSVDASCGVHVHHSTMGMKIEGLVETIGWYALYQPVINSLLPPSRSRETGYCVPMRQDDYLDALHRAEYLKAQDFSEELRRISPWGGRYRAINLEALSVHGTLEFRQHSGSLNGTKVKHWVELTRGFMRASKTGGPLLDYLTFVFDGDWKAAQKVQTLDRMASRLQLSDAARTFFRRRKADLAGLHGDGSVRPSDEEDEQASKNWGGHHHQDEDTCPECGYVDCECCGNCGRHYSDCNCCGNCDSFDRETCGCCEECGYGDGEHWTRCSHAVQEGE